MCVCEFLVFDTQMVVGGKRAYQLSPEEYITGAMELYIDVIFIFFIILGASKNWWRDLVPPPTMTSGGEAADTNRG